MKYQVGDRVKIKSFDWFRNGACIGFSTLMSKYCGEVLTIQSKNNAKSYFMKEDGGQFYWTDDMIEGVMNISKLGTASDPLTSDPLDPKSNANSITRERVDELATKIDKELPSGNQYVWELPDGYQFVDENGNVINATKIALEKKKTEYPKTYEECTMLLRLGVLNELKHYNLNILYKKDLIVSLHKLLICRDAYWKIAGEEMGLGKSWDSKYGCGEWGYWIGYDINENKIYCQDSRILLNRLLVFPTAEMRDAFYKNFKEEIEICKEFL